MRFGRPDFRVESFEYVEVGAGLALLRLAGEWRGAAPASVRLFAAGEEQGALPEPPPDGGPLWRAAFSSSGEALAGPFVLEAEDGRTVELPVPVERGGLAAVAEPEPEPEPEQEAEPEYEPEQEAEPEYEPEPEFLAEAPPEPARHEEQPLHEALAAAEDALQVERERHERTEASLREQLRGMIAETADFMGRLEGYELRRAELEKELSWERLLHKETRRLKDASDLERDEAVARLQPVDEELQRLRREVEASARAQRQLADARERIAELERRLDQQDELLGNARAVVEQGGARLEDLEERLVQLREAATGTAFSENGHAPALMASPEQLEAVERAMEEADRGSERLAQLERRVGELREGIATQAALAPAPTDRGRRRWR